MRIEGETIEMAALKPEGKDAVSLPRPARHHDVIRYMHEQGYSRAEIARSEQGFVTSAGRFMWRAPALRVAQRAGQLIGGKSISSTRLFSEDVW